MIDDRTENKNPNDQTKVDQELLEKIRTLQSLPHEVVLNFLKSKGALASSPFKNNFPPYAEQN